MSDLEETLKELSQSSSSTDTPVDPDPNEKFKAAYWAALEEDLYYTKGQICLGSIDDFPGTDWLGLDSEKIIIRFNQIYVTRDLGDVHGYIATCMLMLFNSCFRRAPQSNTSPYIVILRGSFFVQNQRECHVRYTKINDGTILSKSAKSYIGVFEVGVFAEGILELVVDETIAFNGEEPIEYVYAVKYSERDHSLRIMLFRRLKPEEFELEDKGAPTAARGRDSDAANFSRRDDIQESNIIRLIEAGETGRFLDAMLLYNSVYHQGDVVQVQVPSEWLDLERGSFLPFSLDSNIWSWLNSVLRRDQRMRAEHQERCRLGQI